MSTLAYLIGFLVATVLGDVATKSIIDLMWKFLNEKDPSLNLAQIGRYPEQARLVGLVERSLYFAALLVNQPLWVGVWLTLKTVSRPPRWERNKGNIPGRAIFQPFLVGNGLSLLFSAAGSAIVFLLLNDDGAAWQTIVLILLGLSFVWVFCYHLAKQALKPVRKLKKQAKKR